MLDKLTPAVRHLFFAVAAVVLQVVVTDFVPVIQGEGVYGGAAAALIVALVAYVTPLTRQYGVGSEK